MIFSKKAGDNLYEIYYNGKLVTATDANEAGIFLKDNFWKTERQLEKTVKEIEKKAGSKIRKIVESDGLRGNKALTINEKKEIFNYAKQYFSENAEELIQFADEMSTNNTGYMALMESYI